MPASPAAWSSSSVASWGRGEGDSEVALAADDGEVGLSVHVAAVRVPAVQELVPETVYPELHVGWHVDPLARELVQSPAPPFVGAVDASQGFAEHVAAVRVPAVQELVPETVYPELHVGWHVDPLARELVQSPAPPFVGAVDASQGFAEHVAAVRVPAVQELVPETVYPELHVGWHVDPLARELVQSPAPPFVGAVDASQGFAEHVAAVSTAVQELVPETVYPELHVGWHVDQLARELVQSPTPPFVGAVDASQGGYVGSNTPTPSARAGAKITLPLLAVAAP